MFSFNLQRRWPWLTLNGGSAVRILKRPNANVCSLTNLNSKTPHSHGWQKLVLILLVGVVYGCTSGPRPSNPSTSLPLLRAVPLQGICQQKDENFEDCIAIRLDDWQDMMLLMKSWCLRLGGTSTNCQTEESSK